jgi:galactonate dehydratase
MRRRELLVSLALAQAALPASRPKALVEKLEIFPVKVNRLGNWILVRLRASGGVTGVGDASHGGRDERVAGLLRKFFELLKGRSIYDTEWLRQAVQAEVAREGRPAAVAFGALDQCMWDIRGKILGVPVCDLLGGRLHSRVRNYANINRSTTGRSPAGFAAMAGKAVLAGFDAVKLAPFDDMPRNGSAGEIEKFTELGIERARAVREAIGSGRDLLIDAHNHFDLKRGLALAERMEPLNLYWLEEVTRPAQDLAIVNKAAKMKIAGGESIYGMKGFYPYVAAGAVDILMPDIKYCSGLLELKKISALAEGAGLTVAPHGPASPVGNIAAAHVSATLSNFDILEFSFGETDWRAELIDPPERLERGYLTVPERPGFGIALNEKTIGQHAA